MIKNDKHNEKLVRQKVAGLPLIAEVIDRMDLRRILGEAMGQHGNETFPAVDSLILLIINLAQGKQPLYELERWVQSLDARCLGYKKFPKGKLNDDRFGRALDKLYKGDFPASLQNLKKFAAAFFGDPACRTAQSFSVA